MNVQCNKFLILILIFYLFYYKFSYPDHCSYADIAGNCKTCYSGYRWNGDLCISYLSDGQIVGITIGCVAFLVVVIVAIVLVIYCIKKNK